MKKLTKKEKIIAEEILTRVFECLEFDKTLNEYTDNGNFVISLSGKEKNILKNTIKKFY